MKKAIFILAGLAVLAGLAAVIFRPTGTVDLLHRYPTTLTAGVLDRSEALPWQFTSADIYQLSRFHVAVGEQLKVETGPAKLGIGYSANGAVWAIVIPDQGGKLSSPALDGEEDIASVWLRFHPSEIDQLFPPATVSMTTDKSVLSQMHQIAAVKFSSSFHVGGDALIPDPKDMTVDVDTTAGLRRFFSVDTQAQTAQYARGLEHHAVHFAATAVDMSGTGNVSVIPRIVATTPPNGAEDVDPALTEITVTFDQAMGKGMSWTGGGPEMPPSPAGARAYWKNNRTCVLPVQLQSGHHYRVGINSPSFRNFRNAAGHPAAPTSISFTTK